MDDRAEEIAPGEVQVRVGGRTCRVLVPAGIGVPGMDDASFALAVVDEMLVRGVTVSEIVDVSSLLRADPALLTAVAEHHEDAEADADG